MLRSGSESGHCQNRGCGSVTREKRGSYSGAFGLRGNGSGTFGLKGNGNVTCERRGSGRRTCEWIGSRSGKWVGKEVAVGHVKERKWQWGRHVKRD